MGPRLNFGQKHEYLEMVETTTCPDISKKDETDKKRMKRITDKKANKCVKMTNYCPEILKKTNFISFVRKNVLK